MDLLCQSFKNAKLYCPIENTSDIFDSLKITQLYIKDISSHLLSTSCENKVQTHLYNCSYRYLDYSRRQIFCDTKLEFLDKIIILYINKIGTILNSINFDLQIELLYMSYYIDDKITKHLRKSYY